MKRLVFLLMFTSVFVISAITITVNFYEIKETQSDSVADSKKYIAHMKALEKVPKLPEDSYKVANNDTFFTKMAGMGFIPDPTPLVQLVSSIGPVMRDCIQINSAWCQLGNPTGLVSVAKDVGLGSPLLTITAWGGAAYDRVDKIMYFTGGGHGDSADNTIYSFDIVRGEWKKLTEASALTHLVKRHENSEGRYTKSPDLKLFPGAAHSYDGLIYSPQGTIYYFSMRPSGKFSDSAQTGDLRILDEKFGRGSQYEFNPSETKERNSLKPLTWRLVGELSATYPKTTYAKGKLYLSHSGGIDEVVFDGINMVSKKRFVRYASWGDGLLEYDMHRNILWVIHDKGKQLFGYNLDDKLLSYSTKVKVGGKSLAFDSDNNLVIWDGCEKVGTFSPEANEWDIKIFPKINGCQYGRVYSKWVSVLPDIFVGVSGGTNGVWLYKKPKTLFKKNGLSKNQ